MFWISNCVSQKGCFHCSGRRSTRVHRSPATSATLQRDAEEVVHGSPDRFRNGFALHQANASGRTKGWKRKEAALFSVGSEHRLKCTAFLPKYGYITGYDMILYFFLHGCLAAISSGAKNALLLARLQGKYHPTQNSKVINAMKQQPVAPHLRSSFCGQLPMMICQLPMLTTVLCSDFFGGCLRKRGTQGEHIKGYSVNLSGFIFSPFMSQVCYTNFDIPAKGKIWKN